MSLQGGAKKILLSSVTHVPSRLMGYALAVQVSGQKEGGKIQTCKNFFLLDPLVLPRTLRYAVGGQ